MNHLPRIPRNRPAIIAVGGRSLWLELAPWARVLIGVAVGAIVLAVCGGLL